MTHDSFQIGPHGFTPHENDVGIFGCLLRLSEHFLPGLDDVVACHQCTFPPTLRRRSLPPSLPASRRARRSCVASCRHFGSPRACRCSRGEDNHLGEFPSPQTSWQEKNGDVEFENLKLYVSIFLLQGLAMSQTSDTLAAKTLQSYICDVQNKIPHNSTTSNHLTGPKFV